MTLQSSSQRLRIKKDLRAAAGWRMTKHDETGRNMMKHYACGDWVPGWYQQWWRGPWTWRPCNAFFSTKTLLIPHEKFCRNRLSVTAAVSFHALLPSHKIHKQVALTLMNLQRLGWIQSISWAYVPSEEATHEHHQLWGMLQAFGIIATKGTTSPAD